MSTVFVKWSPPGGGGGRGGSETKTTGVRSTRGERVDGGCNKRGVWRGRGGRESLVPISPFKGSARVSGRTWAVNGEWGKCKRKGEGEEKREGSIYSLPCASFLLVVLPFRLIRTSGRYWTTQFGVIALGRVRLTCAE